MSKYDVTVIGSGPGGYVAAIRCAQLGMKTAIIEKYDTLGGTCLNVGCIPSKALLDSSEHFHNATHHFETHGIKASGIKLDFKRMIERKKEVVDQTTSGIDYLMKKNKIDVYNGWGSFENKNTIVVTKGRKKEKIETDKVIIATGSKPTSLPFAKIDKKRIISSTEALVLPKLPKTMTIIGGGVIGLELGSVYARLGTKVSVFEYMDKIIPTMDSTMSKELLKSLKKLGIEFYLGHAVKSVKATATKTTLEAESKKGEKVKVDAEYCLVAVGRSAYTDKLGLENVGIETDERGKIKVDQNLETQVKGIYAIGDVIQGAMLAHKASEEGVLVAEIMAGQKPHLDYNLVPGVVYTWPEVAAVGKTEEELKAAGVEYKSGSFPFKASGRARASMDTDGLIKVLASKENDEILGVHMIGPRVADIIAEAVVAMEYKASAEDIARMVHAHPTFTESFKEAALDATDKIALHI